MSFAYSRFKKTLWAEDCAAETFYISNFKSFNDSVVRLIKQVFNIILFFLGALRTPNYSLEELLIKSCIIQTCFYINITSTSI